MNHIGTREIATERLTLRRFEIEDAENVFTTGFLMSRQLSILHGLFTRVLMRQRI